jgi:hypothetical protein
VAEVIGAAFGQGAEVVVDQGGQGQLVEAVTALFAGLAARLGGRR